MAVKEYIAYPGRVKSQADTGVKGRFLVQSLKARRMVQVRQDAVL